ncbi:DUF218 domain-containing protein [Arboricoccus pini]|uniref:DUF218 domain-containing protein n=1 Tax=Arboricoccus pini TaxID=1963835 RepID=A0A212RDX1_9PROT|nr:YdcF family protein [Arboricoccus pini]SNB70329.1 DUF218 domain-containing protein [Arboricoccus pini]
MTRYHWIVVFGAAVLEDGQPSGVLKRRIEGGYSAWRRLDNARFILSGAAADHRPSEASVMRDTLLAKGVPAEAMILDETSRDTFASALATWRLLKDRADVRRVWVCTSAFHTPRCRLLIRMQGFRTGQVHVPRAATREWQPRYLYWTLREVPALPWDGFLMLLELARRHIARPRRDRRSQPRRGSRSKRS